MYEYVSATGRNFTIVVVVAILLYDTNSFAYILTTMLSSWPSGTYELHQLLLFNIRIVYW